VLGCRAVGHPEPGLSKRDVVVLTTAVDLRGQLPSLREEVERLLDRRPLHQESHHATGPNSSHSTRRPGPSRREVLPEADVAVPVLRVYVLRTTSSRNASSLIHPLVAPHISVHTLCGTVAMTVSSRPAFRGSRKRERLHPKVYVRGRSGPPGRPHDLRSSVREPPLRPRCFSPSRVLSARAPTPSNRQEGPA
jgi:hypothetical protein